MFSKLLNKIINYKSEFVLILVLFFALLVRCYEITLPYSKPWEIAFQEIIAKNHLIYGFNQTHFVSVISVVNGQNIYHLNHQPLLQILVAVSYFFFGIHEWSARIIPIIFSLGTIVLIFAIADRVWDRRTALFAAFFATFIPMSAYYGRIVNFEPLVLFFVLLFAWAYIVWIETHNTKYFILSIVAVTLGGLTDWPFFLVLPFFVIISLVTREKIRETVFLFLYGCGIAAGYLALCSWLVGYQSGVSNWFSHLLFRSSIPAFIGIPDLYSRTILRLWNNFSITVILAAMGMMFCLYIFRTRHKTRDNLTIKELIPPALFLFGFSYIIIFLESTYIHEWQMYYLIPSVSLFAGFAISSLLSFTSTNRSKTLLVKLGSILTIILFLSLSAQSLIALHNGENFESYYFGSKINEWTKPGDYICIVGMILPIIYYADRPTMQNPINFPDNSRIQKFKPKIVAFPSNESIDSSWSRKNLRQVLTEENYYLLSSRPFFEIWVRDIFVPDILARNINSIEVRDSLTGEIIPDADTKGYVVPSYFIDDQSALFEHPLSKNTIRTNYILDIPTDSLLSFGIGLNKKTWDPKNGDGVQFEVFCQSGANETRLFSQYIDPKNNPSDRKWHYYSLPLNTCSGNNTKIGFATSSGPKNDNSNDWAYWINPRIEIKPIQ